MGNDNETLKKDKNNDKHNVLKIFKSERSDFSRFKEMILRYEYYHKLLKLSFKNNPVLKILYEPESTFNDYYMQMFYILKDINYLNYQECIKLSERRYHPNINGERNNSALANLNKVKFNLSTNNNMKQNPKKKSTVFTHNSLKMLNQSNLKKNPTFDIPIPEQGDPHYFSFRYNNNGEKTLYSELVYLMEKICVYDIKKIKKILLIYPINNLRWIIWLALARAKYKKTQNVLNVSNSDIYSELVEKVELKDDSLMFELHNTLKELKVYKCNWSISLYKIIKCLLLYERDTKYESGMNILIGVPLLISDCNEEDTFFFARYLFSSYYGLGLSFFFAKDELLLNYLVFIVHILTKEKFPDIYEHLKFLNIVDDLWIKKWLKTFFSSIFDLSITIRVWDCVIAVGLKFLVNYSLAIFEYFRDKYMSLKKVKDFLEFFDYDLRKKYQTKKDIIFFRENIIKLAQSYNIPDGKYQLLEKEYLSLLFYDKDRTTSRSEPFDSSKTVNNYYSNNDSLDGEQYHVKQILRTLLYIPSDYLENNVEDKVINKFKKKKASKWIDQKSLKRIEENEKDSEISFIEENLSHSSKSKDSKKSKNENEEIYSNIEKSTVNNKIDQLNQSDSTLRFDDEILPEEINLNPLHKFSNNLIAKSNSLSDKNLIDFKKSKFRNNANKILIDVDVNENGEEEKGDLINSSKDDISENKSDIVFIESNSSNFFNKYNNNKKVDEDEYVCNKEEMLKKSVDKSEESSNYDITRELSFHKEQLPDLINK